MPLALPCLACTQPGRIIGCDPKGRAVFVCTTPDCDVVEYDEQIIRVRGPA